MKSACSSVGFAVSAPGRGSRGRSPDPRGRRRRLRAVAALSPRRGRRPARPLPRERDRAAVEGSSETLRAAAASWSRGLAGLLGQPLPPADDALRDGLVIAGTPASSPLVASLALAAELGRAGDEGFVLRAMPVRGHRAIVIAANRDVGVLYGAFELLRRITTHQPLDAPGGRVRAAPALPPARPLGQPEPHDRARLRGLLALGLAEAARTTSTRATATTRAPTPRSASTAPWSTASTRTPPA